MFNQLNSTINSFDKNTCNKFVRRETSVKEAGTKGLSKKYTPKT
ncbi:hypothetical protein HMPREF0061_1568, partial [Aerococcus viridans ATCC 11563 = CCUG 4311]